jgi:hypothetical protein
MNLRNYTADSIERALAHHTAEGRLQGYVRDDSKPRSRWTVTGNATMHGNVEEMNDHEAAALCFGLASAQYRK